jgi:hypothetical protein
VSSPEYQSLDPAGAPDPVTPADGPSDPAGWAMVAPPGRGPAPYDIQAAMDEAAITAAVDAAGAVSGAGIVYPRGTRQTATGELLNSPQGFSAGTGTSGYDITAGFSGEPDESWANNVQASSVLETPIQGTMDYPAGSTMQDGLQKYGTS